MEKNVKFSVVTICYNVKDELERTLRSLWAQTYVAAGDDLAGDCGVGDDGGKFAGDCIGYESIVVDGGSATVRRRFCTGKKGLRAMCRNLTAGFMTR